MQGTRRATRSVFGGGSWVSVDCSSCIETLGWRANSSRTVPRWQGRQESMKRDSERFAVGSMLGVCSRARQGREGAIGGLDGATAVCKAVG